MEYRSLPQTGLRLSALTLGTMTFGDQVDEADSHAILDYAFEQGINFIDTANIYNRGESERILGKWLKGRRREVLVATKVCGPMGEGPNDRGLSRHHILAAAEASLKRLDTDYIDVYYLHFPDYATGIEETLSAMDSLIRGGKVRYMAISNYAAWQMADILHLCDRRGYTPPVMTQNVYNLITRGLEAELAPFLKAHPLGMVVYNPIAGGLLAGKHRPGTPAADTRFAQNPMYYDRYWSERNFAALEKLSGIAAQGGHSLLELAMKWCAAQPGVTSVITGVSRLSQLKQNIAALEGDPLTPETLAACDEVWHGLSGARFAYNR